jgi:hypothetical protein
VNCLTSTTIIPARPGYEVVIHWADATEGPFEVVAWTITHYDHADGEEFSSGEPCWVYPKRSDDPRDAVSMVSSLGELLYRQDQRPLPQIELRQVA